MTKFIATAVAALVSVLPLYGAVASAGENCPLSKHGDSVAMESPANAEMVSHHKSDDEKKDIVATAAGIEDFSTLVAAVKAAGLVDALKGEGPFTVFAPTNKAFEKLPEGTLEDLLKPENKEKLTNILLYHVVPGKVMAADVVKVESADTLLEGESIKVKVKDEKVFVDDAQVVKTDVEATNGVIHVIDAVILP